jgi:Tfp pilus assembly protein PilP
MKGLVIALMCAAVLPIGAQAPAPQPPPPPNPALESAPSPPPNFQYSPEGRRDPFVSLINRGTSDARTTRTATARADGLPGIMVDEVVVRGIVQTRGGWVAMIGAPNGRTYTARPGDKLMDGHVQTISPQIVILMQAVNDPLSLEKQREVRKYLRGEVK